MSVIPAQAGILVYKEHEKHQNNQTHQSFAEALISKFDFCTHAVRLSTYSLFHYFTFFTAHSNYQYAIITELIRNDSVLTP